LLSLLLPFFAENLQLLGILILIIGFSDIADGYLARKWNVATQTGARLDSLADFFFFIIILIIIALQFSWVFTENLLPFAVIVTLKAASAMVSKLKFGEIVFLHTIANKITGLLVFVVIFLIIFNLHLFWLKIVLWFAVWSALEELCIILINKTIDLNQKSIFKK
jgi:CDP-diacylglycerol--glycerol-3-phosphate 3-phosphatidyltransferase